MPGWWLGQLGKQLRTSQPRRRQSWWWQRQQKSWWRTTKTQLARIRSRGRWSTHVSPAVGRGGGGLDSGLGGGGGAPVGPSGSRGGGGLHNWGSGGGPVSPASGGGGSLNDWLQGLLVSLLSTFRTRNSEPWWWWWCWTSLPSRQWQLGRRRQGPRRRQRLWTSFWLFWFAVVAND
jgi:hypothetical protein